MLRPVRLAFSGTVKVADAAARSSYNAAGATARALQYVTGVAAGFSLSAADSAVGTSYHCAGAAVGIVQGICWAAKL